jgi:hypothetical protein
MGWHRHIERGESNSFLLGACVELWVMNNWQDIDSCYPNDGEAFSTRCGGQGVVIFFGMAKPVRAPQIGPARPY